MPLVSEDRDTRRSSARSSGESISALLERVEGFVESLAELRLLHYQEGSGEGRVAFSTMLDRDPKSGFLSYAMTELQGEDAPKRKTRELYAELSKVARGERAARLILHSIKVERRPEYLFPRNIEEVRGWLVEAPASASVSPENEGLCVRRLSPEEVRGVAPFPTIVEESEVDDEPGETGNEPLSREDFEDDEYTFNDPPRRLTKEEREEIVRKVPEGGWVAPEDEVRYL